MGETSQTRPLKASRLSTPGFYRFSVLFLAFQWIVFGSMHFSLQEETIAQLPEFVRRWNMDVLIVVVTGMLEVSAGVLILTTAFRKQAALLSLVLLVLYIPAVYQILSSKTALMGPAAWQAIFRALLVPNNLLLGLCSLHLLRASDARPADPNLNPSRPDP
jgi:uncharacterized membrane protein YphA (DoxX/SURF4 family)